MATSVQASPASLGPLRQFHLSASHLGSVAMPSHQPPFAGMSSHAQGVDAFDAFVQAANPQHPDHAAWVEQYGGSGRSVRKSMDDADSAMDTRSRRHRRPSSSRANRARPSLDSARVLDDSAPAADADVRTSGKCRSPESPSRRHSKSKSRTDEKRKTSKGEASEDAGRRRRRKQSKGKARAEAPPIPPPRTTSVAAASMSYDQDGAASTSSLSHTHSVVPAMVDAPDSIASPSYAHRRGQSSLSEATRREESFVAVGNGSYLPQRGSPFHGANTSFNDIAVGRASLNLPRQHSSPSQMITGRRSIDFRLPDESTAKTRQEISSWSSRRGLEAFMTPLRSVVGVGRRTNRERPMLVSSDAPSPAPILRPSLDLRSTNQFDTSLECAAAESFRVRPVHSIQEDVEFEQYVFAPAPGSSGHGQLARARSASQPVRAKKQGLQDSADIPNVPVRAFAAKELFRDELEPARAELASRRRSGRRSFETSSYSRSLARQAASSPAIPFTHGRGVPNNALRQDSSASEGEINRSAHHSRPAPTPSAILTPTREDQTPAGERSMSPRSPSRVHRKAVPSHLLSDLDVLAASDSLGSTKADRSVDSSMNADFGNHIKTASIGASTNNSHHTKNEHHGETVAPNNESKDRHSRSRRDEQVTHKSDPITTDAHVSSADQSQNADVATLCTASQSVCAQQASASSSSQTPQKSIVEGSIFGRFRRERTSSRASMPRAPASTVPMPAMQNNPMPGASYTPYAATQSADAVFQNKDEIGLGIESPGERIVSDTATAESHVSGTEGKWRRRLTSFSSNRSLRRLAQSQSQTTPPVPQRPPHAGMTLRQGSSLSLVSPIRSWFGHDERREAKDFNTQQPTIIKSLSPAIVRDDHKDREVDDIGSESVTQSIVRGHLSEENRIPNTGSQSQGHHIEFKLQNIPAPGIFSDVEASSQSRQASSPSSSVARGRAKQSLDILRPTFLGRNGLVKTPSATFLDTDDHSPETAKPRSSFACDRDRSPVVHQLGNGDGFPPQIKSPRSGAGSVMRRLFDRRDDRHFRTGLPGPQRAQAAASRDAIYDSLPPSPPPGRMSTTFVRGEGGRPSLHIVRTEAPIHTTTGIAATTSSDSWERTPSLAAERTDPDTSTLGDSNCAGERRNGHLASSFVMMGSTSSLSLPCSPEHSPQSRFKSVGNVPGLSQRGGRDKSPIEGHHSPSVKSSTSKSSSKNIAHEPVVDLSAFGQMLRISAKEDAARVRAIAARNASAAPSAHKEAKTAATPLSNAAVH